MSDKKHGDIMQSISDQELKQCWPRTVLHIPTGSSEETTMTIPIPLSKDRLITIANLPIDLTEDEALKICDVVIALSIKDNKP